MPFFTHVFANGLRIIAETSPSARSAAVGFFVKTGARDESPEIAGVSHFLEHMVFKGTPRRTALDVNRDFDKIGAHYNAFTSEENTVFYAAILPEYLPQAVDILTDILRPSLREEDFEMEKNVIIEEIGMYEDQPTWAAYDHAKRAFFADHPLGNSVLGTADSIRALSRQQMHAYFQKRYVAANVTVAAAGNFEWNHLVSLIEKHCGDWNTGPIGRQHLTKAKGAGTFQSLTRAKVIQEHVIFIAPGPSGNDPLRHSADTLALALGDDSGSRLYWALVDPGLADSAECSFHEYEGTGSFYVSMSCDPQRVPDNLAIIRKLLARTRKEGLTPEELHQAKSKILSRVVRASERPMGRMQALGMAWTYLGEYRSVDDELKSFEAVSLESIQKVLNQYPIDQVTTFALGPLEKVEAA